MVLIFGECLQYCSLYFTDKKALEQATSRAFVSAADLLQDPLHDPSPQGSCPAD